MQTFVETYNQIEGFHCWPGAPESMAYLANRHRHMFVIRCRYLVEHDDRAIEINKTQRCIEATMRELYGIPMELGAMSCEMLAREIIKRDAFGNPCVQVTVLEDGYGGATLTR